MHRKLTKEQQIELCYRQVSYSRAFAAPIGFEAAPPNWKLSALREAENRRNNRWKKERVDAGAR
jgi:hypothetical protein